MQTDYDYILQKLKRKKEELKLAEREDRAEESREQTAKQIYAR